MFRKLKAGLGGKGKAKFRLDVAVERVEGLPQSVAAARLQWARGAKVAVTKLVPAEGGARQARRCCGWWNDGRGRVEVKRGGGCCRCSPF